MSSIYRVAVLALVVLSSIITPVPDKSWIVVFNADKESGLHEASVSVWGREDSVVIAAASDTQLDALHAQGIDPVFKSIDNGEDIHVLSYDRYFSPPAFSGLVRYPINDQTMLYLLPRGVPMDLPSLKLHALFHGVPRIALPPIPKYTAVLEAQTALTASPLVQQIVDATNQASWFQFVSDLSGASDVFIPTFCPGGCRIRTRASNYMFPPNNVGNPLGNPFATEYLEYKAAGWGFTGPNAVRESYTSAQSGCTTRQGSQTWQNVVFTLPGQVDFAQNQQVIFVVHYDSISESAANDANNSPGADDAISGGSALLEAMRLFKDYAWQRPVKFLFVSGEEVGLCGSTAYTRMHPAGPMYRVLNMDQTAYDGNKDGVMNLYNWSTTSCPSCVAFGDAFVQANSDYGNIINPTKILRNTTKMCQTDHCPFWNIGVTAIDLNENLTQNDLCPCFDQFQNLSCRDTVTQMDPNHPTQLMFDQNYSWPTEKAAIALMASTAVPLYACPATGATVSGTPAPGQGQLTWGAVSGVTNYVVERAAGGCAATNFTGIASTTTASFVDSDVTAGSTYGYRVRTCPFQVSNCVDETIPGGGGGATATTTTVSASPNPSVFSQAVTFTSTTTSSAGIPAGTVTFTEGATVWASNVVVDGTGHASFNISALSTGNHTLTATFTGASGWAGSSGSATDVVNKAATGTALTSSLNPSGQKQAVTFTAKVTVAPPATAVPSGTVTFKDGNRTLQTVSLNASGQATLTVSNLSKGTHQITAVYGGGTSFVSSTSPVLVQTVK